jgi:ABC-type transporter Mla subunit MlaD
MITLEENSMKKAALHFQKREEQQEKFVKAYALVARDMENLTHNIAVFVTSLGNITASIKENENYSNDLSENLAINIEKLNNTMEELSTKNLKAVYETLVNTIEQIKTNTDDISLKLKDEIDKFDSKITNKLSNSLEMIDSETASIIEQLKSIK